MVGGCGFLKHPWNFWETWETFSEIWDDMGVDMLHDFIRDLCSYKKGESCGWVVLVFSPSALGLLCEQEFALLCTEKLTIPFREYLVFGGISELKACIAHSIHLFTHIG